MPARILLAALLALAPAAALAQDRPSEEELFGAPAAEAEPAAADSSRPSEDALFGAESAAEARPSEADLFAAPAEQSARPTEAALFSTSASPTRLSDEVAPEDPLKMGGQFYLRGAIGGAKDQPPSRWTLSAPTLVDGYFDARPNDRVRGMVVGRLRYDPTVPEATDSPFGTSPGPGPDVLLDQLWLRFDLERVVFVTAGKQHVKWGTARFWNPTDFLHPVRRDPLAVFDERTGVTMLKLHAPWEKTGANFYAVALFEDVAGDGTLGRVGGAARAEVVVGTAELGLDLFAQRGRKAKLGLDLSAGLWDLDVYGEVALRKGSDGPMWREAANPDPTLGLEGLLEPFEPDGITPAATVGLSWSIRYNDEDVLMLGAEYFYNSLGYDRREIYPWLMYQGDFQPFYAGRHYAGGYAVLMAPGTWNNTNFFLSTLGNLSDRSYVTRLDYSVVVLTHLRFEAFGAVHYGKEGGEFRFGLEIPAMPAGDELLPAISIPAPLFEAGLGLRISI